MSDITSLKNKILKGHIAEKEEIMKLNTANLEELCECANEIREFYCGNAFDLCTIINGKSGECTEDCKFCAQSSHYHTEIESYPLLNLDAIEKDARHHEEKGILRYSIVTSGKSLSDKEIEAVCQSYLALKNNTELSLCASHGLLTTSQFIKLKEAGVSRYHHNLETSRRFFQNICTTHTYDQKLQTIRNAISAGLEVCSGGMIGLGETMEDRIDMILEIRSLGIRSIPVNILNPIKGTPFEDLPILPLEEVQRTIAIYRFIIPNGAIRMAGGRGLMKDHGKSAFSSGANAAISGDMLTTTGITIAEDIDLLSQLGFEVCKIE